MRPMRFPSLLILTVLWLATAACYRSSPPEIPEFRAPAVKSLKTSTVTMAESDDVVLDEHIEVAIDDAPPEPVQAPAQAAAAPPPSAAVEAPAAAPTIYGTWRMTEQTSAAGSPGEIPPGVEFLMTFNQDGSINCLVSAPEMPEPMSMQGSFTLNGTQITLEMNGESRTGTYSIEGSTLRLIFDEMTIVMVRA